MSTPQGLSMSPHKHLSVVASNARECRYDHHHGSNEKSTLYGSPEEPIVIEDTRQDKNQYVKWEYGYIDKKVLHHRCGQQLLWDKKTDQKFDRVIVRDYTGNHHVFIFEITEMVNFRDNRFKKLLEDFEAGKPIPAADREVIEMAIKLKNKAVNDTGIKLN